MVRAAACWRCLSIGGERMPPVASVTQRPWGYPMIKRVVVIHEACWVFVALAAMSEIPNRLDAKVAGTGSWLASAGPPPTRMGSHTARPQQGATALLTGTASACVASRRAIRRGRWLAWGTGDGGGPRLRLRQPGD